MSIISSLAVCDSECLSWSGRLQPARISGRDVIRISGKGGIRISGTRKAVIDTTLGPLAKVRWGELNQQLETLALRSGGRAYLRASTLSVPSIYDDFMEHLRVRYVITYVSSNSATTGVARTVQVRLVNPSTGAPLRIVDANGRRVVTRVLAQANYSPAPVGTQTSGHDVDDAQDEGRSR